MHSSTATAPAPVNPWLQILAVLEKKISRHSYDTWLKPTRFSHVNGKVIFVRVPTPEFHHIEERFGDQIQEAMDIFVPEYQEVRFVTAEEDPSVPPVRADGGFAPVSVPAATPAAAAGNARQQRFDLARIGVFALDGKHQVGIELGRRSHLTR